MQSVSIPRQALTVVLFLAFLANPFAGFADGSRANKAGTGGGSAPPLVVVIVIDQLPVELFDRLSPLYTGGFKTFQDGGVRFRNAYHVHAITQTGPGHFVLMSGRHPGPAGVLANEFYDRTAGRIVYCVEDTGARVIGSDARGASYRNVDATALGDWMKSANRASLVYSVAGKDRSAVLLGGRKPDGAFWFEPQSGGFTTSTYYADTLPRFVQKFNAERRAEALSKIPWRRLLKEESVYQKFSGPDDAPGEDVISEGETSPVFPHGVRITADRAADGSENFGRFIPFPWMDVLTLNFAQTVVEAAKLGADTVPDLLCVSLSAFDQIGHICGPNSQEVMDAALRIDRELGSFQKFLEKRVGPGRVLMVLTSDHGAQPLVEWSQARGIESARVSAEVKKFRARLFQEFEKNYGNAGKLFLFRGQENIHLDHDALLERRIARKEVYDLVKTQAASETWIAAAFDRDQLLSGGNIGPIGEALRRSFNEKKGADIYFIPKPYFYTVGGDRGRRGTSHGTPYEYDAHVPLIFLWPDAKSEDIDRQVRTVDLAPTLAKILGVPAAAEVDGKVLEELFQNR